MSQTPYIGSKISLISKLDIRYEGVLYSVNSTESTIALAKVRSFGTEDRPTPHKVPARDETYEYIIFKASDIKDLIVCETAKPPQPEVSGLAYDPAIISVTQQPIKQEPQSNGSSPSLSPMPAPLAGSNQAFQQVNKQQPIAPLPNRSVFSKPPQQQRSGGFGHGVAKPPAVQQPIIQQTRPIPSQEHTNAWEQSGGSKPEGTGNYRNHQNSNRGGGAVGGYSNQNPGRPQYHNTNGSRGGSGGARGGGARVPAPRDRLKFDNDYDFEKANEQFQEELEDALAKVHLDSEKSSVKDGSFGVAKSDGGSPSPIGDNNGESFYNKTTSFFDTISCEALEKEEGKNTRPNWKKERMTNQETFGHSAVRSMNYRRGSRGYGGPTQQRPNHYNNSYPAQRYNNHQQPRGGYNGGGYGPPGNNHNNYGGNAGGYGQQQRYNNNQPQQRYGGQNNSSRGRAGGYYQHNQQEAQ